jgi:hypothetical protein
MGSFLLVAGIISIYQDDREKSLFCQEVNQGWLDIFFAIRRKKHRPADEKKSCFSIC